MRGSQQGFTLIELVVVIVILGILAVTAAPRFMDISSDATKASLQSFEGALKSANTMVYAKSKIKNQSEFENGLIPQMSGDDIKTKFGYLSYDPLNGDVSKQLEAAMDASFCEVNNSDCSSDWKYFVSTDHIKIFHNSISNNANMANGEDPMCYIKYSMPEQYGDRPKYEKVVSGC